MKSTPAEQGHIRTDRPRLHETVKVPPASRENQYKTLRDKVTTPPTRLRRRRPQHSSRRSRRDLSTRSQAEPARPPPPRTALTTIRRTRALGFVQPEARRSDRTGTAALAASRSTSDEVAP